MRRRRLLIVLSIPALTLFGLGLYVWPRQSPGDRITRANAYKIDDKLTHAEVEAILGKPGDYRSGNTVNEKWRRGLGKEDFRTWPPNLILRSNDPLQVTGEWKTDTLSIEIQYDASDHVVARFVHNAERTDGAIAGWWWRTRCRFHDLTGR